MSGEPGSTSVSRLVSLCREYIHGERQFTGKPEEGTKQVLVEPFLEYHLKWSKMPDGDYYEREFRGQVKSIEWKDIALLTDRKPRVFIETKACTDRNIQKKFASDLIT